VTQRHKPARALSLPPILTVLVSVWLLTSNPFSKKFLERFGEKSADAAIAFLSWLKDWVFTRVAQLNPKTLFVLEAAYKGCKVEFVTSSTDPATLIEATQRVHDAAQSAIALVDKLEHLGIQKLIYEYHQPTKNNYHFMLPPKAAGQSPIGQS